jgi:segregation and condensation protein B
MSDMEEEIIESEEETAAPCDSNELRRILEAILFASDEIMSPAALKEILPGAPDAREVRKLVGAVNADLQRQRHPFEIIELAGGYQFRTVAYYRPWVSKLLKEKTTKRLSLQALECLAIIAYKQPITKAEVEAVRGVISDGAMKTLLERRMVTIVGRSDKPGRPLLYGTSREFLEYFGVNKLADLPRIEEFESMALEKMEKLSDEELAMIQAAPENSEPAAPATAETAGISADQLPIGNTEENPVIDRLEVQPPEAETSEEDPKQDDPRQEG